MKTIKLIIHHLPSDNVWESSKIEVDEENYQGFKNNFLSDDSNLVTTEKETGDSICFSPEVLKNCVKRIRILDKEDE